MDEWQKKAVQQDNATHAIREGGKERRRRHLAACRNWIALVNQDDDLYRRALSAEQVTFSNITNQSIREAIKDSIVVPLYQVGYSKRKMKMKT